MKQYSQNVATGREVIEHFIKELKNEGITYVPPWQPAEARRNETVDEKYADVLCSATLTSAVRSIYSILRL